MRPLLLAISAFMLATTACSPGTSIKQTVNVVVQSNGQIKRDGKAISQQEFLGLLAQANAGQITLGILEEPTNGKSAHPKRGVVKIGIVSAPLIKN